MDWGDLRLVGFLSECSRLFWGWEIVLFSLFFKVQFSLIDLFWTPKLLLLFFVLGLIKLLCYLKSILLLSEVNYELVVSLFKCYGKSTVRGVGVGVGDFDV